MFAQIIYFLLFYNYSIIQHVSSQVYPDLGNGLDPGRGEGYLRSDSFKFSDYLNHLFRKSTRDTKDEDFKYNLENWTGRWFPENDPEGTEPPLPKPIHQNSNDESSGNVENWTGRWFPGLEDPAVTSLPTATTPKDSNRVPMGMKLANCDDGKTNLTVDWDNSPANYTCDGDKIEKDYSTKALLYCEHIPPFYEAEHKCMRDTIEYDDNIPIYGNHRPEWPVYGEYKFLPKQRWLHSLEHGAVVMLYHPCASPKEVNRLRKIVRSCIRRHIITPYTLLNEDRPLALVTWGCRLTMSHVNFKIVENFIRTKALRGPEQIFENGEFNEGLLKQAKVVSDVTDSYLCPR